MATNLFVGNLPYALDSAKLEELFAQAGTVASAKVISDKYSGRSRGFGFVEMANDAEAAAAISALNGKDAGGRPLTVNEARPKSERSGGRGGFRSGGKCDDYRGHARQPREPRW